MLAKIRSWFRNDEGATAVEYGIMVALIAVVIIGAVAALGGTLNTTFTKVDSEVKKAGTEAPK
jgi:pilus assembly protein Flp/PilA